MPTLQQLRKAKYRTIADFAAAYGCSISTASRILQGRHQHTLTRSQVSRLASLLGVSFKECVEACNQSWVEFRGWTWEEREHSDPEYLEERWLRGDQIAEEMLAWFKRGGSTPFSFVSSLDGIEALRTLGLRYGATEQDIKAAFRAKVKALAASGYMVEGKKVDMDTLTQAKEKALASLRKK